MSDDAAATGTGVIIPADTQAGFGELIELIMKSESMNTGERQYWIDILPVMTPEQIEQLRGILTNERDQLAAIDAKYSQQLNSSDAVFMEETDIARTKKREELSTQENAERSEEEKAAEDLLKQMD